MNRFKKYGSWYIAFFFVLILMVIYKSMDNLAAIGDMLLNLLGILKPFFAGFVIAYILNLPRKRIDDTLKKCKNKKIANKSKGISIFTVYLLAFLIIFISVRALVPAIYSNCMDMYNNAPGYIEKVMNYLNDWQTQLNLNIFAADTAPSLEAALTKYITSFNLEEISKYAQGLINATSGIFNGFIALIVSVYMLIDTEIIQKEIKSLMSGFISEERVNEICRYFADVNDIFSKYIYSRVLDAVIITFLATVILYALRVKYALLLGLMIGVLNLIPYFGSIISTVLAMLIALISAGIFKAVWVGVALTILQQVDGNYIGPKIMENVLEIRPLLVIFAVTVGGGLFGVIGMLISVPITVVIKKLVEDFLDSKRLHVNDRHKE